ncbi:hypothetical protein PAXRUDRAFT_77669, partial [Paxillus rubicundulus Ve08.2h10]
IEYLPPYSPDFNPIEQAFFIIKAHLFHQGIDFYCSKAPYYELDQSCTCITPMMTWGFFQHSGY